MYMHKMKVAFRMILVLYVWIVAYQLALTVVMKNWEPLELGPEFTIETTPECRDIEQDERHEDYLVFFLFFF